LFATIAGEVAFTDLTPASGRQDHTTSPSAKAFSQKPPGGFGTAPAEAFAKADQRRPSRAAVASTASRSNVRDDRETPLSVGRDAQSVNLLLPNREAIYFCGEGWTEMREEAVICPSGRVSPVGVGEGK
jgi:hypothetical protein